MADIHEKTYLKARGAGKTPEEADRLANEAYRLNKVFKNPLELSQAISPVSYSGVPKRALIYEGQTEPDLSWLKNRYNVDLKYRGDTAGDYEISGAKDDVDRFFKDHHLGLTKQYRRKNDGHNFVLYPGTPNSLFSIPDKTGESDVRLKPGQLDSEYEFIKEYLEEQ